MNPKLSLDGLSAGGTHSQVEARIAYGHETWAYSMKTLSLGLCGLSAASRHKLAFTSRHYALLTATDNTALY